MKPVDWRIDYFREASGRSPVESFIDALSRDEKVDTTVSICCAHTEYPWADRGWRRWGKDFGS